MTDDEVRRVLRGLEPDDHHLVAPPSSVWDRIADEVGIGSSGPLSEAMEALHDDASLPPVVGDAEPEHAAGAPTDGDGPGEESPAATSSVVDLPRRRPLAAVLGVAAVLVVVAVIAVTSLLTRLQDPVLAEVDLAALDDRATDTPATIVSVGEGRELHVETDLPATDGHYEVWLIDEQIQTLVSLGPVREDGRYPIPDEVSLAELPVVDISAEPDDGDPSHSGDSILRGVLETDA